MAKIYTLRANIYLFYLSPDGASTQYQISNREFSDFLHTNYCDFSEQHV